MERTYKTIYAWLVHLFTASGAVFGILALYEVYRGDMFWAFLYIAITIIIDAIDGTFARLIDIKKYADIDGALLDNIIDFLTFVIVPCFMVLTGSIVSEDWKIPSMIMIALASCYQFTQLDAKTDDHFFKGFPSYWNIAIFYLYYWQTTHTTNIIVIAVLAVLTFVPIKYIYPSRMNFISKSKRVRTLMFSATLVWGAATLALLFTYPDKAPILNAICIIYIAWYFLFSLYLTFFPIDHKKKTK